MSDAGMPLYPASTIAKLFNLTERRVQQLAKEGVIPKAERGKYDLVGATRGYIKYLQDRALGQHAAPTDLQAEKLRLTAATADEKELQVAQLRGDLIPAHVVSNLWGDMVGAMRARLLALPPRLASKAIAATGLREIEDFARTEVYAALTELADHAEDSANIPADLETDSAAAQING